jgi:hypothetical protein
MRTSGYKFGRKNNWRRWSWNAIKERLPVSPINAVGLYLAGSDDLDRPVAISKGFKEENLIAVDVNALAVTKLRKQKRIALNLEISHVIGNWRNPKLSFVSADLCSGLTAHSENLLKSFLYSTGVEDHCVIALNMLRGRDDTDWLKYYKNKLSTCDRNSFFEASRDLVPNPFGQIELHRGVAVVLTLMDVFMNLAKKTSLLSEDKSTSIRQMSGILIKMNPTFNSYKSKKLTMDSVVFVWPLHGPWLDYKPKTQKDTAAKRQIAAMKAIRTMRYNKKENQK